MRLHRLRMTAFGPFGAAQEVDFDSLSAAGLFLLHGPTGAGKTSVLDAVCYALYGSVPGARQGGQGAGLRSDHAAAGTRAEVCLELTVAGRRLEITRQPAWERAKKRGTGTTTDKAQTWLRERVAQTGTWKDLSRSHQEIGEEISQLLGMSKDQFCQVVLLPQGDFARFLRADAEARGKLLGRLFDTRRFAAVEARLADLRRTAETQVRDGDTVLLADAHRMQQAAGDGVELPLPQAAPGDPGLAADVLHWAAVARTTARERLTIARTALHTAEAAQADARRDLEEHRERHRLQQRHAEAAARAAHLEDRADEQQRLRARMDRARKADTVAPALGLRDHTDHEHRRARTRETGARAALPASHADDGSPGLAAAAREAVEELGGLDSARRAEQRLTGLTTELAGLEREERADDGLLRDAAAWLDGWDSTRADLRQRIEASQDAATRAEHLAGRLDTARQRLDAARRRDRLDLEADRARQLALTARETASGAHQHRLELKEQRLQGVAAELAAQLDAGTPCAVCGATEHPRPASRAPGHVDRHAEEAALAAHRHADEERAEAERALGVVREALAAASAAAGTAGTGELSAAYEELDREHTETRTRASGLHAARERLAQAEREHDRRVSAQQEAARRATARTTLRDTLERERTSLESELARARGDAGSVAARAAQLERRSVLLTEAADAARTAQETAERLKAADARLADAAFRAGFDAPQDASAAVLDDGAYSELQHRLDAHQAEEAAVRAVLAEPATAAAAQRPAAEPEAALERSRRADRRVRDADSARDAAARACTELDRLSARADAEVRRLGPVREEHDRVSRLAGLAAGTSADNERRMRLEAYVLAARLEQVAAAATVRLHRMSSGRYTLVHSDDRTGRARSGLGLHVVDAWTGRERDTATLSGGETFFASLALALGLADVVTDEAGGVGLDTLFIDEGFGSLDEQTLDEVLDVLDSLRERDRSVGIVSHVGDLKRRVHAQLEVVKGQSGSSVRHRGTGG